MNHGYEKVFAALARIAEHRLSEFNVQELANTAWAFVTANCPDEKLFALLARWAYQRAGDFIIPVKWQVKDVRCRFLEYIVILKVS